MALSKTRLVKRVPAGFSKLVDILAMLNSQYLYAMLNSVQLKAI